MARVLLIAFLACFAAQQISAATIPTEFLGTFEVEKSENFDEYLSAKGVSWFARKMIQLASLTKKFAKGEKEGTYDIENKSSKGTLEWDGVVLGKEFEGKGFDGNTHKITFNVVGKELTERRIRPFEGKDVEETYYYSIQDGKLVMKMQAGDIVCRRYFKRIN